MKKFYITSQSVVDIDNSIEVLVEGASIAKCEDMQSTLVVFDNKKAYDNKNDVTLYMDWYDGKLTVTTKAST